MMEMTISSSISVNPRSFARRGDLPDTSCGCWFMDHQSEYLVVPSSEVAWDLEYTSKTFLPHQFPESESAETQRIPHSACPVTGSTGILRRKRTFLSAEAP